MPRIIEKYKQAIFVGVCAAVCFVIFICYYQSALRKAKYSEMDAVIAQGGQLVTMHLALSKDNEKYEQLQIMGMLASEADEKLRVNHADIIKFLPPEMMDSFTDMADKLHELATHAIPSQNDQEAEQVASPNP